MAEYDNTDKGSLFKNKDRKSDKHPEYNGSINIQGVEYWLSAWVKESKKDGSKYFSLAVKQKEKQAPKPKQANQANESNFATYAAKSKGFRSFLKGQS